MFIRESLEIIKTEHVTISRSAFAVIPTQLTDASFDANIVVSQDFDVKRICAEWCEPVSERRRSAKFVW